MTAAPFPLPVERLRAAAASGEIETVIVAAPDLQGRLQGSRLDAEHFCDRVLADGFPACVYLLAADVEMRTGPGYGIDAWGAGFGDLVLVPDPATLRELPWDPGTALVLADARWPGGQPVPFAPRRVLTAQLDRLAARGLRAHAGTELEFLLFREDFQAAYDRDYRRLTTATRHNVDYSIAGVTEIDPVVGRIRREMRRAGLRLESARGECHPGQYEIVFRYAEALTTCDNHALYKTGVRQIVAQEGLSVTFMAKYDEGEGNSCHVHLSLRHVDGTPVFAADPGTPAAGPAGGTDDLTGMSPLMAHFVAGQLACLRELTLLAAPNVNSYKRLAPGAFAPTRVAWGRDNRTCPIRVVGAGDSLRIEHRVAGGDANPYTVIAAIIAAGLYGIDRELPLGPPVRGNAFAVDLPRLPGSLGAAVALWEASDVAREAFGAGVVAHYAAAARAELAAFGRAITDWERLRGFERL